MHRCFVIYSEVNKHQLALQTSGHVCLLTRLFWRHLFCMLDIDLSLGQGGTDKISYAMYNTGSFVAPSECLFYIAVTFT